METKLALAGFALTGLLMSTAALADKVSDTSHAHPASIVKDSAITVKVFTELEAEHVTSMGHIHVDTDADGTVWLSGTARTQAAIDQAVSIARNTEHVVAVHSDLKVKFYD